MPHPSGCPPSPGTGRTVAQANPEARGLLRAGRTRRAAALELRNGGAGIDGDAGLRLRILATTDLHGHLLSYDYFANRPQFGQGLAQTATLIAAARAEVAGSILLDNGDFLQGSALTELAARRARRRVHPAIAAFNALGYDAAALGNHEFNYGLDTLRAALSGARFPVLSANVALELGAAPEEDRLLCPAYTLVRRNLTDAAGQCHPVTVGILGLTPPQILEWDRGHLEGRLAVRGMIEAAQAWVPRMRAAGADVVVCLAHTGVARTEAAGAAHGPPGSAEDCAADLAALPGIDAVVAGHSHLVWPPEPLPGALPLPPEQALIAGKPVVQPGHSGSHLGIIDLWLRRGAAGWQVAGARAAAVSASEIVAGLPREVIRSAAQPLRSELAADHRATLDWMRRDLGHSAVPLHSYFSMLAPSAALQALADAKIDHVRRALQGRPEAALPVLAAVTPFRNGGRGGPLNFTDIPPGPLTLRNVLDIYPFPNTLVALEVTCAMLVARLETAARIYRQLLPGAGDQPLIDACRPLTLFETVPGLSYRIDLTRDDARIRDVALDGRPLAPQARLVLATNSFRTAALPMPGARLLLDSRIDSSEVLADWLRRGGPILRAGPSCRFPAPR